MDIPIIETERLRLRGHHPTDLPVFLEMWQQPAFYQYLGGQPQPEEDIWTNMLRHVGMWQLFDYGYWAVEERATGHFIGAVGFGTWQRAITPSLKGYPEAGWVLAPHTHGRGYAREAVEATLAWADTHIVQTRTVCLIDVSNEPSQRLAARCGYHEFSRTTYKGKAVVLLERLASGQVRALNNP